MLWHMRFVALSIMQNVRYSAYALRRWIFRADPNSDPSQRAFTGRRWT